MTWLEDLFSTLSCLTPATRTTATSCRCDSDAAAAAAKRLTMSPQTRAEGGLDDIAFFVASRSSAAILPAAALNLQHVSSPDSCAWAPAIVHDL